MCRGGKPAPELYLTDERRDLITSNAKGKSTPQEDLVDLVPIPAIEDSQHIQSLAAAYKERVYESSNEESLTES